MNHHPRTLLRSLLILMIAIGPLQGQIVFACSMMDMVMDECCCDDHQTGKENLDSDYDVAAGSSEDGCCDQSVELQVDEDARQDTRFVNPMEIRSDIDPPHAILAAFDVIAAPQGRAVFVVFQPQPIAHQLGSDTYLITQRLRI